MSLIRLQHSTSCPIPCHCITITLSSFSSSLRLHQSFLSLSSLYQLPQLTQFLLLFCIVLSSVAGTRLKDHVSQSVSRRAHVFSSIRNRNLRCKIHPILLSRRCKTVKKVPEIFVSHNTYTNHNKSSKQTDSAPHPCICLRKELNTVERMLFVTFCFYSQQGNHKSNNRIIDTVVVVVVVAAAVA